MIGKQVNFFLTAKDQNLLLTRIDDHLGCALIKRNDERCDYFLANSLEKKPGDWAIAYLCEKERAQAILEALNSGKSDVSQLCALEFIQPMEERGALQRGRFWYTPKNHKNAGFRDKPKAFVSWADRVLNLTKRELKKYGNGDFAGADALVRLEAKEIQFETP